MGKGRLFTIIGLLLFCLVVFLPPIIHGYVYPNVADDTAEHLEVFDSIQAGSPIGVRYLGYTVVGYPLVWLSDLTNVSVDSLFLWFNYLALALEGLTIYLVVALLASRRAGWLAVVLSVFCVNGLMFHFHYGQVFNAMNIGIILPWLLYFSVKYVTQGRLYQLAVALTLGALFGSFHTSGLFLPFMVGLALAVYALHGVLRKEDMQPSAVLLGCGLLFVPIVSALVFLPEVWPLMGRVLKEWGDVTAVLLVGYLWDILSPTLLVMLVFIMFFCKDIWAHVHGETRLLVVLVASVVVVLAVAAFAKFSSDPFRQALDLATMLAVLVAVLVAAFAWLSRKRTAVLVVLALAVGFGLFNSLPTWFSYNSAIRPADREAIAYVDTLERHSYNCSPQIAPWIYDRFTALAKYKEAPDADGFYAAILIVRDEPMTPRSNPDTKYYNGHGVEPDADYMLLETFSDSRVTIRVYENLGKGVIIPIQE